MSSHRAELEEYLLRVIFCVVPPRQCAGPEASANAAQRIWRCAANLAPHVPIRDLGRAALGPAELRRLKATSQLCEAVCLAPELRAGGGARAHAISPRKARHKSSSASSAGGPRRTEKTEVRSTRSMRARPRDYQVDIKVVLSIDLGRTSWKHWMILA